MVIVDNRIVTTTTISIVKAASILQQLTISLLFASINFATALTIVTIAVDNEK
jgi:hypothetical protein